MDHRFAQIPGGKPAPEHAGDTPPSPASSWINAVRLGAIVQSVLALGTIVALAYFAKPVWITLMVSTLIAFTLEPIVGRMEKCHVPRPLGSFLAVLLLLGAVYAISYFSYNRATNFVDELPKYVSRIRNTFSHVEEKARRLEQTREKVLPQDKGEKAAVPVKVSEPVKLFGQFFGAATEVAFIIGFIPFLVYFMLTWHRHAWTKTVKLFPTQDRDTVRDALGEISSMMRRFIVVNFAAGIILSLVSMAVFGALGLPYFYFLGFISGFLSLIPYLGVILAAIVPLIAGLGVLSTTNILILVAAVAGLHLLALNVLYPKLIGSRLDLNPLVVTVGLLGLGWMWGAMGLILAIPIMAAIKIVCDHVTGLQPLGEWMGE